LEQLEKLKSRRRVEGEDRLSEEAKWKKMFLILFPEVPETEVPSPCKPVKTYILL
jgi:hypothetical protein